MKHREKWLAATLVLLCVATSDRAGAVTVGQVDDFGDGTTSGWDEGVASPNSPALVADGQWRHIPFGLTEDDLVCVNSCGANLDDLLSNVAVLRVLSSPGPAFQGESIAATLGMDNLTALDVQEFLLGDMDVNQIVDFDDISPFVLALGDPAAYENEFGVPPIPQGDTNFDGLFDFDDISGFVDLLSGGSLSAQAVPEPSTGLLLASLLVGLSALSGLGRTDRLAS